MGNRGRRLGKKNVSWWPAVRNYLQNDAQGYVSTKQIIAEATLLGHTRRDRILARSTHCPHPTTLTKFLNRQPEVRRKKVKSICTSGTPVKIYVYRWQDE